MTNFHDFFPAIRLFWRKRQIFDFVTFSLLFWLNSWIFSLGWRKKRTLKAKKIRQIVVVSHLQICPRPLQQFTFRSSVELLSVRVLLVLHCNCWTDLYYTKITTPRLVQFWIENLHFNKSIFHNVLPFQPLEVR
jgi:hypothetical protein